MLSGQFYEKKLSVRERKLLLETVTYIAIKESHLHNYNRVMCIMHCRKYHLHNCNRDSHLHNYNKNCHPHICCRNCHLHCAAETSNCITATETVTCIIVTERSTNIPVTPENLQKCNRRCHLHNCHIDTWISCTVTTETAICRIDYRNFH